MYADLLDRLGRRRAENRETDWRLKGASALWGAFIDRHAVYAIAPSRHEDDACDLLADSTAIVTSDRWWACGHCRSRRQVCWSHYSDSWIIPTWRRKPAWRSVVAA